MMKAPGFMPGVILVHECGNNPGNKSRGLHTTVYRSMEIPGFMPGVVQIKQRKGTAMKTSGIRWIVVMGLCAVAAGCQESYDDNKDIFNRFYMTDLKQSASADVLNIIKTLQREEMTQSGNLVVSFGDDNDGATLWYNMVAFDDQTLKAARKYAFLENEKSPQRLRFDAQAVVDPQILAGPYTDENARKLAILNWLDRQFSTDGKQISASSQVLASGTLAARQTLSCVLVQLNANPVQVARLADFDGVRFDHPTLGRSHIRVLIEDDIIKLKIKAGKDSFFGSEFKAQQDVINM